jgi:hypothetical protein
MTIAPKEISPSAIKASATEKHTPMMQQCFSSMKMHSRFKKATPKATLD